MAGEVGEFLYEAYDCGSFLSFRVFLANDFTLGVNGWYLEFQRFSHSYIAAYRVSTHQDSRFVSMVLRGLWVVLCCEVLGRVNVRNQKGRFFAFTYRSHNDGRIVYSPVYRFASRVNAYQYSRRHVYFLYGQCIFCLGLGVPIGNVRRAFVSYRDFGDSQVSGVHDILYRRRVGVYVAFLRHTYRVYGLVHHGTTYRSRWCYFSFRYRFPLPLSPGRVVSNYFCIFVLAYRGLSWFVFSGEVLAFAVLFVVSWLLSGVRWIVYFVYRAVEALLFAMA